MADRLRVVQERIREARESFPSGPVRVISVCAGDGRDLLGVQFGHPRAKYVAARLVDMSPELAEAGRDRTSRAGLTGVEFKVGDASTAVVYSGAVPADIVLFCGIFGNVSDLDVRGAIHHLPEFCARGATVIWTRGRFESDLTPAIRGWFVEADFTELSFVPIAGRRSRSGLPVSRGLQNRSGPTSNPSHSFPQMRDPRPSPKGATRGRPEAPGTSRRRAARVRPRTPFDRPAAGGHALPQKKRKTIQCTSSASALGKAGVVNSLLETQGVSPSAGLDPPAKVGRVQWTPCHSTPARRAEWAPRGTAFLSIRF
jgi:hypothetical protein